MVEIIFSSVNHKKTEKRKAISNGLNSIAFYETINPMWLNFEHIVEQ